MAKEAKAKAKQNLTSEDDPDHDNRSAAVVFESEASSQAGAPSGGTVTPPPAPAGPPAHTHPARLLARARQFGLSDETIAGLSTERLAEVIDDAWASYAQRRAEYDRQVQVDRSVHAPPKVEAPKDDFDFDPAYKEKWDEEFISPIQKAFNDLTKKTKEQEAHIAELRQVVSQLTHVEVNRHRQTVAQRAESFFKKHPRIYGEKDLDALESNSRERFLRLSLFQKAIEVAPDDPAGALEQLHRVFYGHLADDKTPERPSRPTAPAPAPRPAPVNGLPREGSLEALLADRQQEWTEHGAVATPTQTGAPKEEKGKAAAIHALEQLLRKQSAEANYDAASDEADLPD